MSFVPFSSWWNGLGGTVYGSFFRVDENYVDVSLPPGATPATCPQTLSDTVWPIVTLEAFLYTPNSSWFLLSILVWMMAPYRIHLEWQSQLQERLLVNHLMVLGYVGFWHVSLYIWKWCHRPYASNRVYSFAKVLHNLLYTWLGLWQWTMIEVAILHLYRTNQLEYQEHAWNILNENPITILQTLLICVLVPNFRDIQFYFGHRLLHIQCLYRRIHSIHHRNTDTEPFSGLAMHPLEHMIYFTCYLPSLIFKLHPLVLFWMGVHVVLSPAASHSGYEDHFSADWVHYLHHRYPDCNYGVPQSIPLDVWFGTFRGTSEAKYDKKNEDGHAPAYRSMNATSDSKARLGWVPEYPWFNISWILLWVVTLYLCDDLGPWTSAVSLTLGPLWLAILYTMWKDPRSMNSKGHFLLLKPFHNDPVWSQFMHVCLGLGLGVFPATYLAYLLLNTPTMTNE